MTRFWNDFHQVHSKSKDWKAKHVKVLGAIKSKGLETRYSKYVPIIWKQIRLSFDCCRALRVIQSFLLLHYLTLIYEYVVFSFKSVKTKANQSLLGEGPCGSMN